MSWTVVSLEKEHKEKQPFALITSGGKCLIFNKTASDHIRTAAVQVLTNETRIAFRPCRAGGQNVLKLSQGNPSNDLRCANSRVLSLGLPAGRIMLTWDAEQGMLCGDDPRKVNRGAA